MRRAILVVVVVMLGAGMAPASEGFEALVRLVKSGVSEQALVQYAQSSPAGYNLTVDEIVYLSDLGVSSDTLRAINGQGAAPVGLPTDDASVANAPPEGQGLSQMSGEAAPVEFPVSAPPAQDMVQEIPAEAPVSVAPPADQADYSTFYDALMPYGTWLYLDGDWYWQPTAVLMDRGWSPYCQRGHWVYTDCGWAWWSAYSWGWAPFHYGRWRHHPRYSWIWHPDREWGPAWVCWRYSDAVVGWAPLPPEATWDVPGGLSYRGRSFAADFDFGLGASLYVFVPASRFCEPTLARHRLPRSHGSSDYHDARYVQNRVEYREGRVCNDGPPAARLAEVIHRPIVPVTVVDLHVRVGEVIPRPPLLGATFPVFRPLVASTAHETPRQVATRREHEDRDRRPMVRHDDVFRVDRLPVPVPGEQSRGRESRSVVRPVIPSFNVPGPEDVHRALLHPLAPFQPKLEPEVKPSAPAQTPDTTRRFTPPASQGHGGRPGDDGGKKGDDGLKKGDDRHASDDGRHARELRAVVDNPSGSAETQRQAVRGQRQSEEDAARQQEAERQRADALIRAQTAARQRADDAAKPQKVWRPDEGVHRLETPRADDADAQRKA